MTIAFTKHIQLAIKTLFVNTMEPNPKKQKIEKSKFIIYLDDDIQKKHGLNKNINTTKTGARANCAFQKFLRDARKPMLITGTMKSQNWIVTLVNSGLEPERIQMMITTLIQRIQKGNCWCTQQTQCVHSITH